MTRRLDPDEHVLEHLFKKETEKRDNKKQDDKFNYDTSGK